MAHIVADRIKQTTTTQGTGVISLTGAVSGYRSFASQMSVGDTCAYAIISSTGLEWEVGIATYSAVNTLTRTTIQSSTNANNLVNFSAGLKDVFLGPTAGSIPGFNPITNTITSGTWSGNTIDVSRGGTGLTALGTANQVLAVNPAGTALEYHTITSNPGTVTSVGGTGTVNGLTLSGTVTSSGNLTLGGTLSDVNLTNQITGTLPVANGGTGVTTATGSGSVVLSTAPTLTTATFAAGTISASTPNTITQTWNNAAVAFSALTENITDNASASGSMLVNLQVGGANKFSIRKDGNICIPNGASIGTDAGGLFSTNDRILISNQNMYFYVNNWGVFCVAGNSSTPGVIVGGGLALGFGASLGANSGDLLLYRDAADTLAQRRSTNPQAFRVYNTYTDASNYERLVMDWSTTSNVGYIGFQRAGTGATRNLIVDLGGNPTAGANRITTTGTNNVAIYSGNVNHIQFLSGTITFLGENGYGSGATRTFGLGVSAPGNTNRNADKYVFRAIGFGTGNTIPTYVGFGAAYVQSGITSTQSHTQEDCFLVRLLASATPIVAFGDSFVSTVPAIKRSGTQLQIRLADDSADASFSASYLKTPALTVATLPSASTAGMGSRAFVSDASAATFASIVAGGGSNKVPVYSDGTNWLIG